MVVKAIADIFKAGEINSEILYLLDEIKKRFPGFNLELKPDVKSGV